MIKKQNYKLAYGTDVIKYSVVKTRRRKTSEVIVDKNTVEVRAPLDKPDHEIEQVVRNKAAWISKKQKGYREVNLHITKPTFGENSTLPYLGKNYHLKILNQEKNSIRFINGEFVITLFSSKSKKPTASYIERLYEHWLVKTARPIFMDKVKSYSEKLGIPKPEKISIKKLKNRWGSMSKNGRTINLNVNLLKASEDVIDYIVLHELCHLKIKEHSHHFWDLLHKFMPDYQEKIDWLNINGNNLI
jgi:predicted metal-dependent hydrolase